MRALLVRQDITPTVAHAVRVPAIANNPSEVLPRRHIRWFPRMIRMTNPNHLWKPSNGKRAAVLGAPSTTRGGALDYKYSHTMTTISRERYLINGPATSVILTIYPYLRRSILEREDVVLFSMNAYVLRPEPPISISRSSPQFVKVENSLPVPNVVHRGQITYA